MLNKAKKLFLILALFFLASCSSSEVEDVLDIIEGIDRKPIDTSRMGVNAFVNDERFGSMRDQFLEVRDTLGLSYVRILFLWDNGVQPTPGSSPFWGFYDDIVAALPRGMRAFIVTNGLPSWMADPANWIDNNPRKTFAELWIRKLARRYGADNKIIGFQVWNEPNIERDPDNVTLDVLTNPENYVEMLGFSHAIIKEEAPSKFVLNASTTSINQNFPDTLNYNKAMRDAGAESFVDIWAIHYYGRQYERVVVDDGVADFLNGLSAPIWISESGNQGVDQQLAYVEEAWPFLREKIPGIDMIFYYQFTEATPSASTYGLKNLTAGQETSDLYQFLADNNG